MTVDEALHYVHQRWPAPGLREAAEVLAAEVERLRLERKMDRMAGMVDEIGRRQQRERPQPDNDTGVWEKER